MNKLTWFSKSILILIGLGIIGSIVFYGNWIFYLRKNQILFDLSNGKQYTESGLYFKNPKNFIKLNDSYKELRMTGIIQSSDNQSKILIAILHYDYDYDWIKKNKRKPDKLSIPPFYLEHYLLNSSNKFTFKELKTRDLLIDIMKQFWSKTLVNTGYKVERIVIPYPLLSFNEAKLLNIL